METRKEKFIKILKRVGMVLSIGFNVVFLIAIIVGFSGSKKQGNKVNVACAESEVINFEYQNKKFVSYDDDDFMITLTTEELNNYTWVNFNNYFVDNSISNVSLVISVLGYEDNDFSYFNNSYAISNSFVTFSYVQNDDSTNMFVFNNPYWGDFDYKWYYVFDESEALTISDHLILVIDSDYYSDIKQAIELDIQANESNINDGIFETLTDSTVAFIGSLSSGITAMVGVFYDSVEGNLTAIGLLSVIVVAISLCYFLFRLIIGLIRMRG